MSELPAPKNQFVTVLNGTLDILIKGLGAEAAYVFAVSQLPILGVPLFSSIARWLIGKVAGSLDERLKLNADLILIRFQNDIRRAAYEAAMKPIKEGVPNAEQLQKARDAIDALVHRSH